ncbi:MAG TPA: VCBS repeat-containing protein [Anaeromyxobacteraceae bacterium]|nr:VCBS repeat-containing protein [Anaeromyxobacteraceae bacterium]
MRVTWFRASRAGSALLASLLCCSCAKDADFSGYWQGSIDGSWATMSLEQHGQDVAGNLNDMALVGRVDGSSLSFSLIGSEYSCAVAATGSATMSSLEDRDQVQLSYFAGSCGGAFDSSGSLDRLRCASGNLACYPLSWEEWTSYCADGQNDPSNCGTCRVECGDLEVCLVGHCSSTACTGPVPLRAPGTYPATYFLSSLVLADIDGDGLLDAVVMDHAASRLAVLPGTAGGGFASPLATDLARPPLAGAAGDLDGDGRADLVVYATGIYDSPDSEILVLLGRGDGTFRAEQSLPIGSEAYEWPLRPIALADFDGDGVLDFATRIGDVPGVQVRRGLGDGTFGPAHDLALGGAASAVVAADFDGDGRLDLAVGYYSEQPPNVAILLGNGDGSFRPPATFAGVRIPDDIAVGDLDGNGVPDLVVAGSYSYIQPNEYPPVAVLLGKGDGTFAPPVWIVSRGWEVGYAVAVADLDGDGRQDVAVAMGQEFDVILGRGGGAFADPVGFSIRESAYSMGAGDLDGDGAADLVVGNWQDTVEVFLACPR